MICNNCGYDTPETQPIAASEDELEAARYFYEQTIVAMKGHYGENNTWDKVTPDAQQAMGKAAGEFKRRYVCAG